MAAMTPGESAAELLVAGKDALARALTDALYADRPELQERYGDHGRARCEEDMRFNLEHLAPALALDRPQMFAGYARWLHELLVARNVEASDVERSLELMKEVLAARLDAGQAEAVARCVDAGLAELRAIR
jgi:hypothetical protein